MNEVTITVSGLGGRQELTVPEGSTIADLRATGQIPAGVGVRQAGITLTDASEVVDGGHYVTTPPAAKHGALWRASARLRHARWLEAFERA